MAGQRACRHDMRCPHCGSNWMPKAGRSRGKQTYRCGDCKYRYPRRQPPLYSSKVIERALAMYAEGASVAAIGGAMEINESTALVWVKKAISSIRIMDAERSPRKPAGAELPSSVRKIRGYKRGCAPRRRFHSMRYEHAWEFGEGRSVGPHGSGRRRWWSGTAAGGRTSRLDAGTWRRSFGCSAAAEGGEIRERPL